MVWLAVSAGCLSAYAYQYSASPMLEWGPRALVPSSASSVLWFALSFLGNAAEFPVMNGLLGAGLVLCPLLGVGLCVFFVYAARRGHLRRNPAVSYFILFLLLTALGVAYQRSESGFTWSLLSRYGMYSILLAIFAWFAIVEELPRMSCRSAIGNRSVQCGTAVAIVFSIVMNAGGYRYIVNRNRELMVGMSLYQKRGSQIGPLLEAPNQRVWFAKYDSQAREVLRESERLGVYKAPLR